MRVVVMGVAGSGKTTVGGLLARRLGLEFADADEFHSAANVAKMSAGTPLTDDDRWPWLEAIARWLAGHDDEGGVVTCSALKRKYRDVLRTGGGDVCFLHLDGPPEVMAERVGGRPHHFMPRELVASQFETLEPLRPDEQGIVMDAALDTEQIVVDFLKAAGPHPRELGC